MTGTSFAQWIQNEFQNELLELFKKEIKDITPADRRTYTDKKGVEKWYVRKDIKGFWGTLIIQDTKGTRIQMEGSAGFDGMKRTAEALGIKLTWNPESDRYKNHTYYTAVKS
jgi:hypothetical protein